MPGAIRRFTRGGCRGLAERHTPRESTLELSPNPSRYDDPVDAGEPQGGHPPPRGCSIDRARARG